MTLISEHGNTRRNKRGKKPKGSRSRLFCLSEMSGVIKIAESTEKDYTVIRLRMIRNNRFSLGARALVYL